MRSSTPWGRSCGTPSTRRSTCRAVTSTGTSHAVEDVCTQVHKYISNIFPHVCHSYNPDLDSDPFGEEGSLWSFNYFFYNKKLKRIVFFTCRSVRSAAVCCFFLTFFIIKRQHWLLVTLMSLINCSVLSGYGRDSLDNELDMELDDEEELDGFTEDRSGPEPRVCCHTFILLKITQRWFFFLFFFPGAPELCVCNRIQVPLPTPRVDFPSSVFSLHHSVCFKSHLFF